MARFLTCVFTFLILINLPCFASVSKKTLSDELLENTFYPCQKELTRIALQKGQEIYCQLNQNYTSQGEEDGSSTNSTYWAPKVITLSKTAALPSLYLKDTKVSPSLALEDLIAKGGVMECFLALSVAKAAILKELLGNPLFDVHVSECIQSGLKRDDPALLHHLCEPFLSESEDKDLNVFMYIPNIPDYMKLYPTGVHLGENVMRVDADQFIGFGHSFKDGPLSLQAIEDCFYLDLAEWYAGIPSLYAEVHEMVLTEVDPSKAREWYASILGCSAEMARLPLNKEAFLKLRRNQLPRDLRLFDVEKINMFVTRYS